MGQVVGLLVKAKGFADWSATRLARAVRSRELSPVDVLDACLERVDHWNQRINAIVTFDPGAREVAERLERRLAAGEDPGPLAGVPVGIKDVTPVAGLRTTYGSPLFADHVPAHDALVVRRLREAGAIVLGKTNTPEFAAGGNTWNPVFGVTRNPWNPDRSAGGSTGGGAAGLATGMIALAEGTDLGGSLRIPAAFCGVVGLRPSPGLVPTVPSNWTWDTLQVTGPMARTVADVALMLQAIAGPSPGAPLGTSIVGRDFVGAVERGPGRPLRVAFCADPSGIGVDAAVASRCRAAAESLGREEGIAVEEVIFDLSYARGAFLALRGHWFASWMYEHLDRVDEFGVNVKNNVRSGLSADPRALAAAEGVRGRVWRQCQEFFERFDHLLTPTMAVTPFPVEQNYPETVAGRVMPTYVDWIAPTFLLSLTGLPVASVPCGLDGEGMPVGLQVMGRPMDEESVLALAAVIESRHPMGRPLPIAEPA